jgi:lipopolysaccharide transport system ATP-binding protein
MSVAIKIENLSKAYQLGEIGTGTLAWDLERWFARIRGKEDPFLKIGEANDRTVKGSSNIVWSLKDIDFSINQGDAVGIIGRNGAGKSTLLKILSRVTTPTTGKIKVKGRIASLLEVGTGFHPELTGRENIYLNGAILGMRKMEITRKFDEIVSFAGVERYIDTPVKRYSSGMYVRLAFAVAAHLDCEILIVDEVLAVGDAEFQKSCLGKMEDVSKNNGRTVLFVSHNMGSIASLCEKGILLSKGRIEKSGSAAEVISTYLKAHQVGNEGDLISRLDRSGTQSHKFSDILFFDHLGNPVQQVISGTETSINFFYQGNTALDRPQLKFTIYNRTGQPLSHFDSNLTVTPLSPLPNSGIIRCAFNKFPLSSGFYTINVVLVNDGVVIDYLIGAINFNVLSGNFFQSGKDVTVMEDISLHDHNWSVIK